MTIRDERPQDRGSRLLKSAIEAARQSGADAIILLGYPSFYPRFGLRVKAAATLAPPLSGESFKALPLTPGALAGQTGWWFTPRPSVLNPARASPSPIDPAANCT